MMTETVLLFVAYMIGTLTGFALYRQSLIGRVVIALDKVLNDKGR